MRNPDKAEKNSFLVAKITTAIQPDLPCYIENETGIFETIELINGKMANSILLNTYHKQYKYANKANINGTLNTLNSVIKRPIYARESVKFANVLPSEINLNDNFQCTTFDCVGTELSHDCNSGETNLILVK